MFDQYGSDGPIPFAQLAQVQHALRFDLDGRADGQSLTLKADFQNPAIPAEMRRLSKFSVRQEAKPDYRLRVADHCRPGGGIGGSGWSQALAAVPPRDGHARIITYWRSVLRTSSPTPSAAGSGGCPRPYKSNARPKATNPGVKTAADMAFGRASFRLGGWRSGLSNRSAIGEM
jgi:hypothetical protein